MRKIVHLLPALFLIGMLFTAPNLAHAVVAHKNFIFGADSTQSLASQTGAKSKITIVVPQTFSASGEDHNWHVEGTDSSGYKHLAGYFVNTASPSTPKFFAEEFLGGVRKLSYQGTASVGNNGDQKYFAFHKPSSGTWQYYVDNSPQTGGVSTATSLNVSTLYALAEKICPTSPYCTKDQGGPMPSINMENAMMYTSSSSYLGTWNAVTNAQAYYQYINSDGSSSSGSGAQSEMCQPMSMKGKVQDATLVNNRMIIGNNVVTTCTTANNALWP